MNWTRKADLRYKIREMELEAVVQEKRDAQYRTHLESQYDLHKQRAVAEAHEQHRVDKIKSETEVARLRATVDQLERRVSEAPNALLIDLLKALLVKMPTLNITDLAVTVASKEKK